MYQSGMRGEMEKDIDLAKLDVMAKNNNMLQMKQLDLMKNEMRKCGSMFSYVTEAKSQFIAEELQRLGYGADATQKACGKILMNQEQFPPFKHILELVRGFTPKAKQEVKESISKAEDERLAIIREEFLDLFDRDHTKLKKYVSWWVKNCYDESVYGHFKEQAMIFEKPALFDWKDTGITNKFDRIIDTFNRKAAGLRK